MDFIHIAHAATEAAAETNNGGALGALGINLKLFIAQLINFAVVLLVLWKWVFKPVAKKLQERTDRIEKAMNDAASTSKEKEEFGKWKNEQIVNTRHEASVIIHQAQTDAGKVKEEILQKAKEEQQKLVEQAKAQIQQEKTQTITEAKSELADLVTNAAEKILRSKLDGSKDKQLIQDSLKEIG